MRQRKLLWWWLKRAGGLLLAVVVGLVVWGLLEPRVAYDVEYQQGVVDALPPAWEGRRVGVLADMQIGMWADNPGMVERIVARTVRERPELVLLAGDFIFHVTEDLPGAMATVISLLRPLVDAEIPTYAVLGNHDWGMLFHDSPVEPSKAQYVEAQLEAAGIPVLRNEAVAVAHRDAPEAPPLWVVGIGPRYPQQDRPHEALAGVPAGAPRIVLMHHPDTFAQIPAGAAPLAVAGHTHGGQIRIAGFPHWGWKALFEADEVHTDGWIEESFGAPGNRLYVNRGIGFSFLPIRIHCMPELTLIELRNRGGYG